MQIIHWLLKAAYESPTESKGRANNACTDDKVGSKDIVLYTTTTNNNRGVRVRRSGGGRDKLNRNKNFNLLNLLRKRDITKACFYSTLSLKRLGSIRRSQQRVQVMKMRKETTTNTPPPPPPAAANQKAESAGHHVGNAKVLPISDATVSSSETDEKQRRPEGKKEKPKGDRKTLSKMKELVRWAAAARTDKGRNYLGRKVMQFRNRPSLKTVNNNEDEVSKESPKISFRWDLESCSTITCAYSQPPNNNSNTCSLNSTPAHDDDPDQCFNPRKGNWITTDSEFVVLEL